eukprot:gene15043-biopygen8766
MAELFAIPQDTRSGGIPSDPVPQGHGFISKKDFLEIPQRCPRRLVGELPIPLRARRRGARLLQQDALQRLDALLHPLVLLAHQRAVPAGKRGRGHAAAGAAGRLEPAIDIRPASRISRACGPVP